MRTKAIILKKQNTGEYDQLVTCFTEEFGKITAVAKSILKPSSIQSMHLDIFNLVDFELVNSRSVPIITGANTESAFPNLKNDLSCSATAFFFTETADRFFFEYQRDDELWDFFNRLLGELDSGPAHTKDFLKAKQLEFLDILGYIPNLKECAFCAAPISGTMTAYSTEAKGGICQKCFLSGQKGVIVKESDLYSPAFIGTIYESIAERKIHSLNLINSVLK